MRIALFLTTTTTRFFLSSNTFVPSGVLGFVETSALAGWQSPKPICATGQKSNSYKGFHNSAATRVMSTPTLVLSALPADNNNDEIRSTGLRRSKRKRISTKSQDYDTLTEQIKDDVDVKLRTPRKPRVSKRRNTTAKATVVTPDSFSSNTSSDFDSNGNVPEGVITPDVERSTKQTELISPSCRKKIDFGNDNKGFSDLGIPPEELRPSATLTTGQCFHWKAILPADQENSEKSQSAWGIHNATEWVGILRITPKDDFDDDDTSSIVVTIRETPTTTLYQTLYSPTNVDVRDFLLSYFQLNDDDKTLKELYQEWSGQCNRLKQIADCLPGVRIIDQDPWECLVSFLCSSNNNIPRITKMLQSIREEYGDEIIVETGEGSPKGTTSYYSFPSFKRLMNKANENDLRNNCGMGYRAKYLMETMKILEDLGGERYLQQLRSVQDPVEVQKALIQFCGVGQKVADCIALFSLKQSDAIPVDVHVLNIARRDYNADEVVIKTTKSLTPTVYKQVGDLFRSRFPVKSGWAHSLLFVAELPSFRAALPKHLVEEMDAFKNEEQTKKKAERNSKRKTD